MFNIQSFYITNDKRGNSSIFQLNIDNLREEKNKRVIIINDKLLYIIIVVVLIEWRKYERDVNVYTRVIRCSTSGVVREPETVETRNTSVHCQINCTRFVRRCICALSGGDRSNVNAWNELTVCVWKKGRDSDLFRARSTSPMSNGIPWARVTVMQADVHLSTITSALPVSPGRPETTFDPVALASHAIPSIVSVSVFLAKLLLPRAANIGAVSLLSNRKRVPRECIKLYLLSDI